MPASEQMDGIGHEKEEMKKNDDPKMIKMYLSKSI